MIFRTHLDDQVLYQNMHSNTKDWRKQIIQLIDDNFWIRFFLEIFIKIIHDESILDKFG